MVNKYMKRCLASLEIKSKTYSEITYYMYSTGKKKKLKSNISKGLKEHGSSCLLMHSW